MKHQRKSPLFLSIPLTLIFRSKLGALAAAEILQHLITATPRYRRLVNSFHSLAALDIDYTDFQNLRAEAEQGLADELRAARVAEFRAAQGHGERALQERLSSAAESHSANGKASWDALIIPQGLRENLQAYVKILRDLGPVGQSAKTVPGPVRVLLTTPPLGGQGTRTHQSSRPLESRSRDPQHA